MKEQRTITPYIISLREKILESATHAFTTKGIKAVKMDDIAKLLSISKRTLYEIYENKEVLLLEVVRKYKSFKDQQFKELYDSTPDVMDIMMKVYLIKVEEFKLICPTFYDDLEKYPSVTDFLYREKEQSRERFLNFLRRGVAEGYFRSDLNLELVVSMFNALMEYIMKSQLYKTTTIEEIFHNILFVPMRGFCTPEGAKRLDQHIDKYLS